MTADQSKAEAAVERLEAWLNPAGKTIKMADRHLHVDDIRLLLAERRGFVEALEPFATAQELVDAYRKDLGMLPAEDDWPWTDQLRLERPTVGDFRRARSALQGKGGGGE